MEQFLQAHLREKVHRWFDLHAAQGRTARGKVPRTKVIVRRVTQNCMVTKGYRRGVYVRLRVFTRFLSVADKGKQDGPKVPALAIMLAA